MTTPMSSVSKHLYKCIDMYYEIEYINRIIQRSFFDISNLTKRQKKSPQYIAELNRRKDEFIFPEVLDYSFTYNENALLYNKALDMNLAILDDKRGKYKYGCIKIPLDPNYYKSLYDDFIDSYNSVTNETDFHIYIPKCESVYKTHTLVHIPPVHVTHCKKHFRITDYFELKDDKLYIYDINILFVIFANMNVDFNIYFNFNKNINHSVYTMNKIAKLDKLYSITVSNGSEVLFYKEQNKENVNDVTLDGAIAIGDIEFAEYCLTKINIDKTNNKYCYKAILKNDITLYEWLKCNEFNTDITQTTKDDSYHTISNNYHNITKNHGLTTIMRLIEYGYKFNNIICNVALYSDDSKIIKWLISNGYKYKPDFIRSITELRNLELLQFAKDHGYKINIDSAIYILKDININHHKDDICVKIFKWLIENGCPWTKYENNSKKSTSKSKSNSTSTSISKSTSNYIYLCDNIIETNNIELIKWSVEHGCPWNDLSIMKVIKLDDYELLRWAIETGCEWANFTQYNIDKKSLDWNDSSMNLIIKLNNISLLKWAVENGCIWNKYSMNAITKLNNISLLNWAVENGCK